MDHGEVGLARIGRHFDEAYLDRVRAFHTAQEHAKSTRKHRLSVEPHFAEAKGWHGRHRFRVRGLEKVNGGSLLIAAGQNFRWLRSRWGRCPFPNGTAGIGYPALQPLRALVL